ncbi:MAG: hypothetical protein ABIH41_06330 [Nanoarchaeota archaeon]
MDTIVSFSKITPLDQVTTPCRMLVELQQKGFPVHAGICITSPACKTIIGQNSEPTHDEVKDELTEYLESMSLNSGRRISTTAITFDATIYPASGPTMSINHVNADGVLDACKRLLDNASGEATLTVQPSVDANKFALMQSIDGRTIQCSVSQGLLPQEVKSYLELPAAELYLINKDSLDIIDEHPGPQTSRIYLNEGILEQESIQGLGMTLNVGQMRDMVRWTKRANSVQEASFSLIYAVGADSIRIVRLETGTQQQASQAKRSQEAPPPQVTKAEEQTNDVEDDQTTMDLDAQDAKPAPLVRGTDMTRALYLDTCTFLEAVVHPPGGMEAVNPYVTIDMLERINILLESRNKFLNNAHPMDIKDVQDALLLALECTGYNDGS